MKKSSVILLLLCSLIIPNWVDAQCPPGDVTLNSQADVIAFAAMYPTCTVITGNVEISGSTITDLSILPPIGIITGNLRIASNSNLNTLVGLGQLTTVIGFVQVFSNGSLLNINGFDQLAMVGGFLNISSNISLQSLAPLSNLTTLGGNLQLLSNGLTSLTGLHNLPSIGGILQIDSHFSLFNLTGLDMVSSIAGDMILQNNPNLQDLTGLGSLTTIGSFISLANNASITSLNGLGPVSTLLGLNIDNNDALIDLNGLNSLDTCFFDITITDNDALASLDGLEQLDFAGAKLQVFTNPNLSSLLALNHFMQIVGQLTLIDNMSLSTCEVQAVCDHLALGRTALIGLNLPGCNTQLEVETSCASLPVEFRSFIAEAKAKGILLNWTTNEFPAGGFEVQRSTHAGSWTSISRQDFDNIINSTQKFEYLDTQPFEGTNYYRIKQTDMNGIVEYSQTVSASFNIVGKPVRFYPNPASDKIYFAGSGELLSFRIIDQQGRTVLLHDQIDRSIDISPLPTGIYSLVLRTNERSYSQRLIRE